MCGKASSLLVLLACLLPAGAWAGSPDIYGYSKRGLGMGNATTATADSYDALHANPANLGLMTLATISLDTTVTLPGLWVERADPTDYAEILPEPNVEVGLAYASPLGGIFSDRVGLGMALLVPLVKRTRPGSDDYRRPQFPLYDTTPETLVALAGVGVHVWRGLAVGAGLSLFGALDGTSNVALSILDQAVSRKDVRMSIVPVAAPYAGVTWQALGWLRVAASWQGALAIDYDLPIDVVVDELGVLRFELSGRSAYVPHRLNLGAAATLPGLRLTLAADARWWMWSRMPPISSTIRMVLDDSRLLPGAEVPGDLIRAVAPTVEPDARDALEVNLGVEWAPVVWLPLRAGYFYRGTPLPAQTGDTNYLDRDVHALTLGVGLTPFAGPGAPGTYVDLGAQVRFLGSECVTKAQPGGPTGDYRFGGLVTFIGLSLRRAY